MNPNDRILNVIDPAGSLGSGATLPGLLIGSSAGNASINTARLNNLLNTYLNNDPAPTVPGGTPKAGIVYFPLGLYLFDGTIAPPAVRGVKFMGGGGMPKSITPILGNQPGAYVVLRYTGSNRSIPLLQMGNHDGWVLEGLTFDGQFNPDTIGTSGTGQQIILDWSGGGIQGGGFFGEVRNCGFFRAQTLIRSQEVGGGDAFAEIKFNNCMFCCGDSTPAFTGNWDAKAFRIENNQSVNIGIHQCEFNFCPVLVACNGGGRVVMTDITMAICGLILETGIQSHNINGHKVDGVHLDMAHRSMLLYKSTDPFSAGGPVEFNNIKFGARDAAAQDLREFVAVQSWSGNSLILSSATSGLWVRVGDRIGFVLNTDRENLIGEATVVSKSSNQYTYNLSHTAAQLGINPADPNLRAIHGECLITCVTSDKFVLSNTDITPSRMQGRRLARLSQSPLGRSPKLKLKNVGGFTTLSSTYLDSIIRKTGTCWWNAEDVHDLNVTQQPQTFGNYGGSGTTPPPPPPPPGGTVVGGDSEVHVLTRYGVSRAFPVVIRSATTGQPLANITFVAGDLLISQNAMSPFVPLNDKPVQTGSGIYSVFLSAAELQAAVIKVLIRDQDATPVFSAASIGIDTYGSVNAQHEFDLDNPTVVLTDGSLTAAKIAANAITADKIQSAAITHAKFSFEPVALAGTNTSLRSIPEMLAATMTNLEQPRVTGTNFQARGPTGGVLATYALNDAINPTEKIRVS